MFRIYLASIFTGIVVLGCSSPKPPLAEAPPATVSICKPITDLSVQDYQVFIGTTDAAEKIEVRAHVTGYLKEMNNEIFVDRPGSYIQKGTVLFQIDPAPFKAKVAEAEAQVKITDAEKKLGLADRARIEKLLTARPPAATIEERDKAVAQVDVSQAKLESNQALLEQAKINLDYTKIVADVEGYVSRNMITPGNLVTADQTLLTTIVKPDPMYVYFDVDQNTVERYRRDHDTTSRVKNGGTMPLYLGLELDKNDFPYEGMVNFADNTLNPSTGALQVRGVFYSKDLKKGQKPIEAGFTARVRAAVSPPQKPILVPDRAIGTDQSQKFVYVINSENKVEYRKVTLGNLYNGKDYEQLRAITNGLNGDEQVVVIGLQSIRPGVKVETQVIDPKTLRPLQSAPAKK